MRSTASHSGVLGFLHVGCVTGGRCLCHVFEVPAVCNLQVQLRRNPGKPFLCFPTGSLISAWYSLLWDSLPRDNLPKDSLQNNLLKDNLTWNNLLWTVSYELTGCCLR